MVIVLVCNSRQHSFVHSSHLTISQYKQTSGVTMAPAAPAGRGAQSIWGAPKRGALRGALRATYGRPKFEGRPPKCSAPPAPRGRRGRSLRHCLFRWFNLIVKYKGVHYRKACPITYPTVVILFLCFSYETCYTGLKKIIPTPHSQNLAPSLKQQNIITSL